nr:uncharacterized mitochondrial protein AtMg00810-like [Tanacetum cinerariifolium]
MTQKLGIDFWFTMKACFVCGSMGHLIKDYTFHEDRMAKKSVLPNNVVKGTGYRESRPVYNNVQRINHENKFAPTTVFTRSGRIPVITDKPKAAASTSDAKLVNTAGPKQSVNFSNSRSTFHKSHSPIRRSFNNAIAHSRSNSTKIVNTAGSKAVSVVKGNEVTVVKAVAGYVWRPRVNEIDQISKDNRWICMRVDYVDPHGRLKCSRHMIGNNAYHADYQEINNGGFVAFGSSRCKITGKVSARNQTDKNEGPQDTNGNAGTQDNVDARKEVSNQHLIMLPLWSFISSTFKSSDDKAEDDKPKDDTSSKPVVELVNKEDQAYRDELNRLMINAASNSGTFSSGGPSSSHPDTFILDDTLLHMDAKSAFLYGTIEEEVYVSQPPGFIDPQFSTKVYKVTPKLSHLHAVKMIFRYLKGQPNAGLWYPKDSLIDLEAYSNSDYVRANLERKFTIGDSESDARNTKVERSRFLRYIDTRPNAEALRKCILSGPYKPTTVLVQAVEATDDSLAIPEHTTVETPMNMSLENKAHFLSKKEAIHLIMTGIGDEIYPTVDACQTAQKMWEAIERLQQGESLNIQDVKTNLFWEFEDNDPEQAQRDKDMQKNLDLIAKYFKKMYKPNNNNLRSSSNSRNKNVDTTLRYKNDDHTGQFGNQRTMNVAEAREKVGSLVVQQSGIQCFNCKEYGHFAKEYRKPKRVKDSAYPKEKMLLCKQAEQGVPL